MLYKGKLPDEVKTKLKQQFTNCKLYLLTDEKGLNDTIVKAIDTELMVNIRARQSQSTEGDSELVDDIYNMIVKECVLWPELTIEEFEELPIGTVPSVATGIQRVSDFTLTDIKGDWVGPRISQPVPVNNPFNNSTSCSEAELKELRIEYTGIPLYEVSITTMTGPNRFILRSLTRKMLSDISTPGIDADLATTESVVVWPKNYDWTNYPAGGVSILAKAAWQISGLGVSEPEITEL